MATFFSGDPIIGTADADIILERETDSVDGGAGDDLILADFDFFYVTANGNSGSSSSNPFNLSANTNPWTTFENPLFEDESIPHVSILVTPQAGSQHYWSVVVAAGETLTVDIDSWGTGNLDDPVLEVSRDGVLVNNFFPVSSLGGEGSLIFGDPFTRTSQTDAATYIIHIDESGSGFDGDEAFLINISVTGHPVSNASFSSGGDDDVLNGGDGWDLIMGVGGNDTLNGGDGIRDYLFGGTGDDVLNGEIGDDSLEGGEGNDLLGGGEGNDTLRGAAGLDTLNGGDGDDSIVGGPGVETLDGGDGIDALVYRFSVDPVFVSLSTNFVSGGDAEGDIISGFEKLIGGGAEDTLIGSAANDEIRGISGNDRILGLSGDDELIGNTDNDTLNGGSGNDSLDGGSGDDTLVGSTGNDTMIGDDGSDTFFRQQAGDIIVEESGGTDIDTVISYINGGTPDGIEELRLVGPIARIGNGNALDNLIAGNAGSDTLNGSAGNDTLSGNGGGDELSGANGDDRLLGSEGFDTLMGGNDDDRLEGQGDIDILYGGAGNDDLFGGMGRDTLTGDAGADRFIFGEGETGLGVGGDRIMDFSQADGDRIDLRGIDANGSAGGEGAFSFIGAAAFSGTRGELRYRFAGPRTEIEGDIDGDGSADFTIRLEGVNVVPAAGDFLL